MIRETLFTSELSCDGPEDFLKSILDNKSSATAKVETIRNSILSNEPYDDSELSFLNDEGIMAEIKRFTQNKYDANHVLDVTCCLKGLFLKLILKDYWDSPLPDKFYVSFGGDMVAKGAGYKVLVEESHTLIGITDEVTAIFTSGNTSRRNHIDSCIPTGFVSLTTVTKYPDICKLDKLDAYTTTKYSNPGLSNSSMEIYVDEQGITTIWS